MELSKIAKVLRMLVIIHCAFLGAISYSAEGNWVDLAVHNFGAPINTMWAEGELSFSGDGTMV